MSIRILSSQQLAERQAAMPATRGGSSQHIPPLLFADPATLYLRRAERLRTLAAGHPMADYLNFAAGLVTAQHQVMLEHPLAAGHPMADHLNFAAGLDTVRPQGTLGTPLGTDPCAGPGLGVAPLDRRLLVRGAHWLRLLDALISRLRPTAPGPVQDVLDTLAAATSAQREIKAGQLLQHDFQRVGSGNALFLWSALSLYWAQLAGGLQGHGVADDGENRQFCPVCGSLPVAGVVTTGTNGGLRYLHCNLCETQWHVVRAKCSNCEKMDHLNYWSIDSEQAAVKAESCDDCGSYIKLMYREKDPQLEAVADDLATMNLDQELERKGLGRSSFNPLLFPGG